MKDLNDYDYWLLLNLLDRYCEQLSSQERLNTADLVITLMGIISHDKSNL